MSKSATGWMVTGIDGVARVKDQGDYKSLYLYPTKDAARVANTGGEDNKRWWRGCEKNGFRLVQVRVSITEV